MFTHIFLSPNNLKSNIIDNISLLFFNIYVEFGGIIFQQVIGNPMGTNMAPLLADLFLNSYESEFIQQLQRSGAKKPNVIRLI